MNLLKGLAAKLLALLFPPSCALCGALLKADAVPELCANCRNTIDFLMGPTCKKCDRPVQSGVLFCGDCSKEMPDFIVHISGCVYEEAVRNLMLNFKFHNKRNAYRLFADMLIQRIERYESFPTPDLVLCVPMSEKGLERRGYNQAELIAGRVAARFGWNFMPNGLVKVRDTGVQSTLPPDQRRKNVCGAYAIGECDVAGKRVLVIDDIFTTGSTMMELTHLLKSAGAEEVLAATACITRFGAEELPERQKL